jgi:thiamine biosynthesis lipoprotein
MGMPITVEILDAGANTNVFSDIWSHFSSVDRKYSTYKKDSEISKINNGLQTTKWSPEMKTILRLCEQTKQETGGYFNIIHNNKRDPSGLVKGWAINNAAKLLLARGFQNFYIEAGGDIQVHGLNAEKKLWRVGIRNPFKRTEVVKIVAVTTSGVATSGTYIRGQHIYNPHKPDGLVKEVASLTVVGPNIYEADRFATAAFAMGKAGIEFIESLASCEAYMIDDKKQAVFTSGFEKYVVKA